MNSALYVHFLFQRSPHYQTLKDERKRYRPSPPPFSSLSRSRIIAISRPLLSDFSCFAGGNKKRDVFFLFFSQKEERDRALSPSHPGCRPPFSMDMRSLAKGRGTFFSPSSFFPPSPATDRAGLGPSLPFPTSEIRPYPCPVWVKETKAPLFSCARRS